MISLTIGQSFVADYLNLIEILILYRYIVNELTVKYIAIDFLVCLMFVFIPVTALHFLLLVTYLRLFDLIINNSEPHTNNTIAMITTFVVAFIIDVVDHYTFVLIDGYNLSLFGWFLPLNELIAVIILGVGIKYWSSFQKNLLWFKRTFNNSRKLRQLMFIYFISYLVLSTIPEQKQVANDFYQLLFVVYFVLFLIGGLSLISLLKSYQQNQVQQALLKDYELRNQAYERINQQADQYRRERHDLTNFLLALQGEVDERDFTQASALLTEVLGQRTLDQQSFQIDQELTKIKVAGIRNVIKAKAVQIIEQQIPFSVEISHDFPTLPGSEIITARIIGILLDNAFEAGSQQANPMIQIAILQSSPQSVEIVVSNSLEQELNLNQIFKSGTSSKANHQGVGLANVLELVNQDERYAFEARIIGKQIVMSCIIQEGESSKC